MRTLNVPTPKWGAPLLKPARYKGAYGGRASGKSHFFAENLVLAMIERPSARCVSIREIQKSLKFSAKQLIADKIDQFKANYLFDVQSTEIKRKEGTGICIFQGMQDHTADSIKSLEGFDIAWTEEAQSLSARSLSLLRPTIRKPGSELWFSWNPDQPDDPIDKFLRQNPPDDAVVVRVNWMDNPFFPEEMRAEMEHDRRADPDAYAHIWEGAYNVRSDAQIFAGRYEIDEFTPGREWDGPYFGADFGFAQDPTVLVKVWLHGGKVYIEKEAGKIGLDIDRTGGLWNEAIPEAARHRIRADSARPETISYLKRNGFPMIEGVDKWSGSVEDGVEWLRTRRLVIHPSCHRAIDEARLYRYKTNRAGDVLAQVEDKHNHVFDAVRYALSPMIRGGRRSMLDVL